MSSCSTQLTPTLGELQLERFTPDVLSPIAARTCGNFGARAHHRVDGFSHEVQCCRDAALPWSDYSTSCLAAYCDATTTSGPTGSGVVAHIRAYKWHTLTTEVVA
jgi:hypothetical protein